MIRCDGQDGCTATLCYVCNCGRCNQEADQAEKFHSCINHTVQAASNHDRIRERAAYWVAFDPLSVGGKPAMCFFCDTASDPQAVAKGFIQGCRITHNVIEEDGKHSFSVCADHAKLVKEGLAAIGIVTVKVS